MHHSEKSGADIMNAALVKCENGESISVSAGAFWPGIGVTKWFCKNVTTLNYPDIYPWKVFEPKIQHCWP